jgi:cytochrome c oxidase cbb3-type subunit III
MSARAWRGWWASLALGVTLVACDREQRRLREVGPPNAPSAGPVMSSLRPGGAAAPPPEPSHFEGNAYSLSEGQRLFQWYNCVGCHGNGGGGMGPPLIDARWIYGSEPENIFETIVEGRPNGMPSFRGRIPDFQVWQLVAYVRGMSGMVPPDVIPGRTEHMNSIPSGAMNPGLSPTREEARH